MNGRTLSFIAELIQCFWPYITSHKKMRTKRLDWIRYGDEMRRPLLIHKDLAKSSNVVIVGGGLSGLCCAYRLASKRPDIEVVVLEQSNRLGGVIDTWRQGEWVCDVAVNATRPHPSFWRLVDDLGLSKSFKSSNPKAKARWVLLDGKAHELSMLSLFKIGPLRLWRSIINSRRGGKSVANTIPHPQIADAFCLGIVNDVGANVDADFLVPSLTKFGTGVTSTNLRLRRKIKASYPIFVPRRGSFASLKDGMHTLVQALEKKLNDMDNVSVKLNSKAENVSIIAKQNNVPDSSVIWAAPFHLDKEEATELSIFAIGFHQDQVSHLPLGYGTLIPDSTLPISGILHESDIHHSKRCPENHRLFRLMVPHQRWDSNEDSVISCAEDLLAPNPVLFSLIGTRKIPKFRPGYMAKMSTASLSHTYVGWGATGVAITHVVAEAERLADCFDNSYSSR